MWLSRMLRRCAYGIEIDLGRPISMPAWREVEPPMRTALMGRLMSHFDLAARTDEKKLPVDLTQTNGKKHC